MTWRRDRRKATLVLEDGSVFSGYAFAGAGEACGEVVFNTGMTGYQEVITDPSYKGQIVVMTYPHVGNYGINPEDMESAGIYLEGFVVKEYHPRPSNWRSRQTLREFLEEHGKIGIAGLDTRALTRRLRLSGAMKGIISTQTEDIPTLLEKVRAYPGLVGRDLVREVSCKTPYLWKDGGRREIPAAPGHSYSPRVVVVDCGVKYNILRHLEARGCEVIVVPATVSGEELLSRHPDGVLFSNGPGDPAALPYLVDTARQILGKVPVFGICLGHQILGQAVGGKTEKLKFGHHGINQPVKDHRTGKIEITSQNHGFVVVPASVARRREATHENLNDCTSEGLSYPDLRAFSVQYHPEAAPGPHDAAYLFDRFLALMEKTPGRPERAPEVKQEAGVHGKPPLLPSNEPQSSRTYPDWKGVSA
ncbi:MAG TPA: glutamine-hydrolyzing carbamoyl-phosphate synthase small subunit [Syntrophales bacterium]|nr:glutamine-hydrolyzing carbamoyl-phosphate synthase small subunit [Syntrophales bacterium]HOU77951.1 glutamine-hydrolyzing carbamoyl-phosphate synthase small subunit [Syntrophales bacterium]HQG34575.1 glutamine-hydrolyzing carbamoyl-phosphate synthase small subunit [Syntrophales bacterium]HQI35930.1 glutamine-hydrolyzing carbamoyl-phosphate synthase small subunit [Syntrophales bacterium]HRU89190.1 glutamine-hydrolyzing carbamoyl-phosphate synthase small subunit [Syntrophales bacterium]